MAMATSVPLFRASMLANPPPVTTVPAGHTAVAVDWAPGGTLPIPIAR